MIWKPGNFNLLHFVKPIQSQYSILTNQKRADQLKFPAFQLTDTLLNSADIWHGLDLRNILKALEKIQMLQRKIFHPIAYFYNVQYYVAATAAAGHNVSRKFISQTISTMANRCLETTSRRYHVYCRAIGRSENWWGGIPIQGFLKEKASLLFQQKYG